MADFSLIEILNQGTHVWNRWLASSSIDRADLAGVQLAGRELRGIDLSSSELAYADFTAADLTGADLHDSGLEGACFRSAKLDGADISRVFAPVADFSQARMKRARLGESKLAGADFREADLLRAKFDWSLLPQSKFIGARLKGAVFTGADLSGADFSRARMHRADLAQANLTAADLTGAILSFASLARANLTLANLTNTTLHAAFLEQAMLVETIIEGADLCSCSVYGISAWELVGTPRLQTNLVITSSLREDPVITVDELEVAHFLYLLLDHSRLNKVLNSVMEQGVLLLGRFRDGGLETLRALASELRAHGYLPIIFDFERPRNRNLTETVKTLVGLSRFVVADLSGPSVPQELMATVPDFKLPFALIIEKTREFPSMLKDFLENDWVLKPIVEFAGVADLLEKVPDKVIAPAEEKHKQRQKYLDARREQA